MKKIIFLFLLMFIFSGCATTRQSQIYRQKQGLMLLENTEHPRNKKYHEQKRRKSKFRSNRKAKDIIENIINNIRQ